MSFEDFNQERPRGRRARRLIGAGLLGALVFGTAGTAGAAQQPPQPTVVGGSPAATGAYPFMVSIQTTSNVPFCGGSLIRPKVVLTAAHCVSGRTPSSIKLAIGRTQVSDTTQGEVRNASAILINPNYTSASNGYDAALITLSSSSTKTPINLLENSGAAAVAPGQTVRAIGWGATSQGGAQSPNLLQVDLPVQSDAAMNASGYGSSFKGLTMLGAGPMSGGKDTCQGDSGGPLFTTSGGFRLVGATSWGSGCAQPNFPGIYAELWDGPIRTWVEQNARRSVAGFVWANSPTSASYTPSSLYSRNSTGGVNTITRSAVGNYTVRFANLGGGIVGGTVDVTAYGSADAECHVGFWGSSGPDQTVNVRCSDTNGNPIDTFYTAAYTRPVGNPGAFAHLWANSPTSASYTPSSTYSFNSTGGINTISRSGVGVYQLQLPGLGVSAGTVKVTAYGSTANRCKVVSWFPSSSTQLVNVRCFSATGAAADSMFTATFSNGPNVANIAGTNAWVWANQPTSASYSPSPSYSRNSAGGANTIVRNGTGSYTVQLASLGVSRGDVQVTAYGSDSSECKVVNWGPSGTTENINVQCRTTTGSAFDTFFVLQFIG